MKIWRLEPIDLTSPHWERSTHRGRLIVRAADEERARTLAKLAFDKASEHQHAEPNPLLPPWSQEELVACVLLEGSVYPDDGPEGILEPEHVDHDLGADG